MERECYICWYRLNQKDAYLIWFSTDESDGVYIDENGIVPSFEDLKNLRNYGEKLGISVDIEKPNLHNLDLVENWLSDNKPEIVDYNPFLEVWNLFDDISISTNGNFDSDRKLTKKIYNKIFWGCNISAVTPEGKSYEPIWTKKELKIIHETLSFGFQMFKEKVREQKK